MRVVIVGGGIAAVYLANNLKKQDSSSDVVIVSDEKHPPYDRIHLCRLIDETEDERGISLPLDPTVKLELNQTIKKIDRDAKRVFSDDAMFSYDKLILATGSIPITLFDISEVKNAAVFRSADDCDIIRTGTQGREVVIVGSGPIGLELLETLNDMPNITNITLLIRGKHLYSKDLSIDSIKTIEECYTKDGKIKISYEDEIVDKIIENGEIVSLQTKKLNIKNPFLIFGTGIKPNIASFKDSLKSNKGILTNLYMQTEDESIYAVGECAEVEKFNFVAGHVKECTMQADCAISHIVGREVKEFELGVSIDMLKVGEFDLIEVNSPKFSSDYEKILITSKEDKRIDEYFLKDDKLTRFIGINSNVDVGYIETLVNSGEEVDINYLYQNRLIGERGRLICSCEHVYHQDLVDIVTQTGIGSFSELSDFSEAGRVCGRCKMMVQDVIKDSQHLIDPNMPRKTAQDLKREREIAEVQKRIDKFNALNPRNNLTTDNLDAAMNSLDIAKSEVNSWVSMVTANMQLHPNFEQVIEGAVCALNKVPIIWLELADCSGNSEAFIKSTNPAIEDIIFDYVSLDYHELLMSASGDQSETILEDIITNQKGEYILIVEGAVPLAIDGKYLRIGPKGETGIDLLKKCAKDAALVISVGSCAFDGGVVAAYPNPTGAVGVAQALHRDDIINLSGCPTNPTNIVGTLLSYLMFEELPPLDKFNRPLWAYSGRVHDDCERRGNYELGEFVKEWGDEGAKKGWCLFEMGCKGPYTNVNCPTMKFNGGTSWPVQAGHGCMGCVEMGFFDKFANERKYEEEKDDS
ncbi:quinone-reactive Ni/Fe-hydrogenase, small chain precursor [Sulfurimonas gotlandica GD1]|uniref:Quinone-reactive Ni/Fe-hydrogenase, small chain n=1 Tax=Sulfurimonas gotlandica (strain DSM 19862 / JCM 16533 / GD1) TaxID=929558 RepID=B6BMJ6_SULGG|nr:hydrogenase small subunit [Sulfurimonas gotlandica]EDZ61594.1 quinone-reactive Ni/Fe-hydrogenase small chain [Sulfurimonas gotlandica GD1]EHP30889.1 quinone-reactive Ni/Fe-hydrogenase, small chain precursor [Sulfurimonas gotlandica GD1]